MRIKMHVLTLSTDMLQVLDAALQSMPYRQAAPVINEINRQLTAAQPQEEPTHLPIPQKALESALSNGDGHN